MSGVKYNDNKPHQKESKKITLEELKQKAAQDKAIINDLKSKIVQKIKSPDLAKKAAEILSQWGKGESLQPSNKKKGKKSA